MPRRETRKMKKIRKQYAKKMQIQFRELIAAMQAMKLRDRVRWALKIIFKAKV